MDKNKKIEELLSQMTLEEKVAQLDMASGRDYSTKPDPRHGCSVLPDSDFYWDKFDEKYPHSVGCVHDAYSTPAVFNKIQKHIIETSRLGIPAIFTAEALHGITGLRGTVYPVPLAAAATFNEDLVYQMGDGIGTETRVLGMHEILAPNLDVCRDHRWGREEETFGEDTYLASRMGVAIIKGEQKGDVSRKDAVACEPKHYCVHGIPEGGINCAPARVGKREIESSYLPVFEAAVKEAGAYNAMASYNSIDGDTVMCSQEYLTDILKDRIGMKGFVRSDWGGITKIANEHKLVTNYKDAIKLAIGNGLDVQGLDCESRFFETTILELIEEGKLSVERIDDAVRRVLGVKFDLGLFENPYTDETEWEDVIRCEKHRMVSLEVARQSLVLMENKDNVLPLSKDVKSIAIVGPSSNHQKIGGYSSIPTDYRLPTVVEEVRKLVGDDVIIKQCDGCAISEGEKKPIFVEGQPHLASEGEEEIKNMIPETLELAKDCDVIIFVGGDNTITSGEGKDRSDLRLPGQQRFLIEELAKLGKKLIIVAENGKAIDLSVEKEVADAILVAWFGGEHGAQAIAEAIFGVFSPSGKLPISFPPNSLSMPCYYSNPSGGFGTYYEGQRVALYEFGYGLSYTSFSYSNMQINKLDTYDFQVSVDVTNTGSMDSDEVVQLYIDDIESSVVTPAKLLKAFQRIHVKAGETQTVTLTLNYDSFKLFNLKYEWVVEPGNFNIMIARSSRETMLEQVITI